MIKPHENQNRETLSGPVLVTRPHPTSNAVAPLLSHESPVVRSENEATFNHSQVLDDRCGNPFINQHVQRPLSLLAIQQRS